MIGSHPRMLAAGLWLLLAAYLLWAGYDLGIGQLSEPGSGFLVFWGGALIGGFAAWSIFDNLHAPHETLASLWRETRWGKVILVVVALLLYAGLLSRLGFLLATPPLLLVFLRAVDPVPWLRAVPVALGSTLGIWWVLERLLSVRLPAGLLG